MAIQNTTLLLDESREACLQEQPEVLVEVLVKETADALIQEVYGAAEPLMQPTPAQLRLNPTYPTWPTSTPGPQATLPLPGMTPLPMRTDQMIYECYDQERGVPCTAVSEGPSRGYATAPSELSGDSRTSATFHGLGSTRQLLPRQAIITTVLLDLRSIPMPVGLILPMKLILTHGSEIVLSSSTSQGREYADGPSD